MLRQINPKLLVTQENVPPPPSKKLKRWQLSKQKKRKRERVEVGESLELEWSSGPDNPALVMPDEGGVEGLGAQTGLEESRINFNAKLEGPKLIFHSVPAPNIKFNAKTSTKPTRSNKVKAEKMKRGNSIKNYFKPFEGKSANTKLSKATNESASSDQHINTKAEAKSNLTSRTK